VKQNVKYFSYTKVLKDQNEKLTQLGQKVNEMIKKMNQLTEENEMLRQMCKFKGLTMQRQPLLSGPVTMKASGRKSIKRSEEKGAAFLENILPEHHSARGLKDHK